MVHGHLHDVSLLHLGKLCDLHTNTMLVSSRAGSAASRTLSALLNRNIELNNHQNSRLQIKSTIVFRHYSELQELQYAMSCVSPQEKRLTSRAVFWYSTMSCMVCRILGCMVCSIPG